HRNHREQHRLQGPQRQQRDERHQEVAERRQEARRACRTPILVSAAPSRRAPGWGGALFAYVTALRSAASTRGSASSTSRTDTAPTLSRNHPFSPLNPKAWNGTIANPASSSRYFRTWSFVRKPRLPIRSNCTER